MLLAEDTVSAAVLWLSTSPVGEAGAVERMASMGGGSMVLWSGSRPTAVYAYKVAAEMVVGGPLVNVICNGPVLLSPGRCRCGCFAAGR